MKRVIRATGGPRDPYSRTTGGDPVVSFSLAPAAELASAHRALLRTMSFDLIMQEVERREHQVCLHTICKFSADRLPAGRSPMGDGDLPFDASDQRP